MLAKSQGREKVSSFVPRRSQPLSAPSTARKSQSPAGWPRGRRSASTPREQPAGPMGCTKDPETLSQKDIPGDSPGQARKPFRKSAPRAADYRPEGVTGSL